MLLPERADFKAGDVVQLGSHGKKGEVTDSYRPLKSYILYSIYKIHLMTTSNIQFAARRQLSTGRGLSNSFDAFQIPHLETNTGSNPNKLFDQVTYYTDRND